MSKINKRGFILLDSLLGLIIMIIIIFLIYMLKINEVKVLETGDLKLKSIQIEMKKNWEDYQKGCDFDCHFKKDLLL